MRVELTVATTGRGLVSRNFDDESERRHELQHNALADWLAQTVVVIRPYQNLITIAVTVVLVVLVGYTWWSHQSVAQTTQAWDEMSAVLNSGNVAKLAKVIEDYPNTNVAQMAAVLLADCHLGQGCERLFVNKASAQDELSKAIQLYESVREDRHVSSLIEERATFGLARAKEAKGELAQAERLYEDVVSKWPKGAYAAAASQRAVDIGRPATKSMYDRFAHFDPKPAFSDQPGERPSFDLESLPSDGPDASPDAATKKKP